MVSPQAGCSPPATRRCGLSGLGNLHPVTSQDAVWAYADDLQRLATHLCRHPQDAQDVAHTALVKAAEHLDGFRGEASMRTWLHTIATNECRMLRRRTPSQDLNEILKTAALEGRSGSLSMPPPDPETLVLEAETRRRVVNALTGLPESYQKVLMLKDGCGLRAREVAQLLNTTVPAAKSMLFRARRSLRAVLGAETG